MYGIRPLPVVCSTSLALTLLACVTSPTPTVDPASLITRAERSGYRETSRYDEVVRFMEAVAPASPRLQLTTFGYTYEGRPLPMMVFGDLADASPEAVLATGKTRIWIQGNIHAGEVCGKEAMLVLLRDLAQGEHADWADSLVLLIAPIYNADGNERVRIHNRGLQNGPIGGMGQRPNAQGYDLNRDHMKLDSPEARSLVQMMRRYDPHLVVDLHTTDGSRHAYHVTYSPPLNPNTYSGIDNYLRQQWLPAVTRAIKEKHGWDYYFYGNAVGPTSSGFGGGRGGGALATGGGRGGGGRGGARAARRGGIGGPGAAFGNRSEAREPGWYTFDHRPRFNNNYVGLRNRFAILSEAYAYASFEERILASLYFVEEIVNYASDHSDKIRQIVEEADAHSVVGETMAVRAVPHRSDQQVEILMGEVERLVNPYSGRPILNRLDVTHPQMMYEYGTFEASASERAPAAYLVPGDLRAVIDKLEAHGVALESLEENTSMMVEQFVISSSRTADRPFQGHNERTLEGSWEAAEKTVPAGTKVIGVDQPLGRLVFYLLEPRSDDGLVDWNILDPSLGGNKFYPILRTMGEF
ncbi:MAG: M14 family metallopeptidase [Acidobacteriota bacterium]